MESDGDGSRRPLNSAPWPRMTRDRSAPPEQLCHRERLATFCDRFSQKGC